MTGLTSRSPRNTGFHQLHHSNSNASIMNNAEGIALQPVKSHGSVTGARRPNTSTDTVENEKGPPSGMNGHIGRRKRANTGLSKDDGDDLSLNAMGRIYSRIVGFSPTLRYLFYVAPVGLLLAVPLIVLPLTGNRHKIPVGGEKGPPLFLLFLWIEVSWLSLWLGKIAASTFPVVFMFFCGVVSSGTRKYANVIRALEIPISLLLWALVAFLVFASLFKDYRADNGWVKNLQRVLQSLLASSGVYLGEKALVQLIAISYHQRSFALRIKESKHEIYMLGLLYDASRTLFPMYCPEFADEDYVINDSIQLGLGNNKKKGVNPIKLIGEVGRFGDKVTSVFGNIASEITGKKVFNPNSAHSVVVEALEKARSSEALARRIWMSFVCEGRDALYIDDLREVLGPAFRSEADEAFSAIDGDGNGDISLDEMTRKVVDMGKERKAINEGMKDISQALTVFDKVLLFVVLIIVVLIFLAFFQSSLVTTIGTAATALLSLSFVFAVTTQEFLGSCIFLFVKHPYDVGDRIDMVNGGDRMPMQVDKISLLYTVFTRIDKMKVVQIPNIKLNELWIENVSRSKAMRELVTVNISFDTSLEDIELIRSEMEKFVRHPDNSRDFQPEIIMSVGGIGDLDKMELDIYILHKSNWHNEIVRATRRSKFMCALALTLKKIPVYSPGGGGDSLGSAANPSYSVAVSDETAAAARAKAKADRNDGRMIPIKPADEIEEEEKKAAKELNTTNPTVEAYSGYGYDRDRDDDAASHRRSVDGESLRYGPKKTAGSHHGGRRRPGEGVTAVSLGDGQPGLTLTATRSHQQYDEEAHLGLGRNLSTRSGRSARFVAPPPAAASAAAAASTLSAPATHPTSLSLNVMPGSTTLATHSLEGIASAPAAASVNSQPRYPPQAGQR